jgi:hypothetical protein
VLLAFVSLWWFVLGQRRDAVERDLDEEEGPAPDHGEDEQDRPVCGAHGAVRDDRTHLQAPAPPVVRNPLYAIPWFVFIGDASANVTGLLDAAVDTSSPSLTR